jgi:hypothetical protein
MTPWNDGLGKGWLLSSGRCVCFGSCASGVPLESFFMPWTPFTICLQYLVGRIFRLCADYLAGASLLPGFC